MRNSWITLLLVVAVSSSAISAEKSYQQYWEDLGFDISVAADSIETGKCYQAEVTFLACVHAINSIAKMNGLALVSSERQDTQFKVDTNFGAVKLVKPANVGDETLAQLYRRLRKEKQINHNAWLSLFANRDLDVNFETLIRWVTGTKSYREYPSFVTGTLINAYVGVTNDPHTMFMPIAYVRKQMTAGSGDFVGIGARFRTIKKNGTEIFVIESPLEGSPALRAGLRSHDIVTHVDGTDLEGLNLSEVVKLIKGTANTKVVLTVNRNGKTLDIAIIRGLIKIQNVRAKVLTGTPRKLGYIKLNDFIKSNGCDDVKAEIRNLVSRRVDGLIFDLRNNGGGLISQAVCMGDIFLSEGKIVVTTKALTPGVRPQDYLTKRSRYTDLPMVTLINHRSASASELLSGALQDHQRSFVVGERSFGKGSVQNQIPLKNGLVLRKTVALFYQPSGRTNQVAGIYPDVEVFHVPNPTADDKVAFREEDEYMAIPSIGKKWVQPRPKTIATLNDCTAKRGTAAKRFEASKNDAIAPDFQLLKAEDILRCVVDLGLSGTRGTEIGHGWSAANAEPEIDASRQMGIF